MDDYKYTSVMMYAMKQKQHFGVSTHPRVCVLPRKIYIKKIHAALTELFIV